MKNYKIMLILILSVLIVAALVHWFSRTKPVEVNVKPVAYGLVQDMVANTRAGTIKACRRAGISPSIGGQIARLPVKEGDKVQTGQLLMELWNDDLLAQLEQAQSEAISVEATAKQACITARAASREAKRQKELRINNLTSEEAVDRADSESRALQSACNAALTKNKVSQSRINVVRANLEKTRLKAPFTGTVAEVNGEIGEFVTPSPVGIPTPPSVDLVDVSCLYVSAPIDEVDAPQIRVDMPAKISLDAMAGKLFEGKVRRIAPYILELEKQARTIDVEVNFICPEDCEGMLPGYSADIEVILNESPSTLRIPTESILEGNKVLILTDNGLLEEREIHTGLSNWDWTEVTSGVVEGQLVVVSVEREGVTDGVAAVRETQANND